MTIAGPTDSHDVPAGRARTDSSREARSARVQADYLTTAHVGCVVSLPGDATHLPVIGVLDQVEHNESDAAEPHTYVELAPLPGRPQTHRFGRTMSSDTVVELSSEVPS
jgi:hypothetical protein